MKVNILPFLLLFVMSISATAQEFNLPQIFSHHMVLQREVPTRFWGWDVAGQEVSISMGDISVTTITNEEGKWEAFLPKQNAGGPFTITIKGSGEAELNDVYVGDVWIAGGQSNMEWAVGDNIDNMEAELNDADYPEIRFFKVNHKISVVPLNDLESGEWKTANKEHVKKFSAVAWFFAKHNHIEKGVPVGIIDDNWGGTPAEAWTPVPRLLTLDGYQEAAKTIVDMENNFDKKIADNEARTAEKYRRVEDTEEFKANGAHLPDYDDTSWEEVHLPNAEAMEEFIYLRKSFTLEEVADGTLSFGNPGKFTVAFINGEHIYTKTWSDDPKVIDIPANLLRKGENVIAVRTVEDWTNMAWFGKTGEMWVEVGNTKIDLEGAWKFNNTLEEPMPVVFRYEHSPGTLFNAMINPVAGYTLNGAIWYQGESNVDKNQYYNALFEAMIEEWRMVWNQGDFPFMFVQLANYQQRYDDPTDSGWARLQEAQTQTLSLANTGMALAIDIGNAEDVHPRNKQDVGTRLWLNARHLAYNEQLTYSGPMYRGHVIKGAEVELSFDHVGKGLVIKNFDELVGFAIAGADKKFYWADAKIVNDRVILSAPVVPEPVAVRYGWADNPAVALYNQEGLPAVPFRTDEW